MGKTSLALSIALHAARRWQKRIAMFSLEMSDEQLVQRLISAETGIDSQRLRLGDIKENEWPTFMQATNLLSNTSIFIDDTPAISALELRTKAAACTRAAGCIIGTAVDVGRLAQREPAAEVSYISARSKLARELNVQIKPSAVVSQMSPADKRPMLSDRRIWFDWAGRRCSHVRLPR
jgi:replicative DNA helicase